MVSILLAKKKRFKTSNLISNLRDYSDAYVVVKGIISVRGNNANKQEVENFTFIKNARIKKTRY